MPMKLVNGERVEMSAEEAEAFAQEQADAVSAEAAREAQMGAKRGRIQANRRRLARQVGLTVDELTEALGLE